MSFDYVRNTYGIDVKRGTRVLYTGNGSRQFGTVKSASGSYLNIVLDGEKFPKPFHPTWELTCNPTEDDAR